MEVVVAVLFDVCGGCADLARMDARGACLL